MVRIPTWIFRGFTNTGREEGWIFTALGGDNTGGIIWHPSILETAAQYGLHLTSDNMLVDTEQGAARPKPEELLQSIDRATLEGFRRYTPEQMRRRVVTTADRQWSEDALLDSRLPGHASAWAPAIVAQTAEAGRGTDHNGYVAPSRLLPPAPAMAAG